MYSTVDMRIALLFTFHVTRYILNTIYKLYIIYI